MPVDEDLLIARAVLRERHGHLSAWLLEKFNHWFCSGGGVWQTAMITIAIVALEASRVLHDTHGFWLLYWLTVYSAVTQPALAHAGAVNEQRIEQLLTRIEELETRVLKCLEETRPTRRRANGGGK